MYIVLPLIIIAESFSGEMPFDSENPPSSAWRSLAQRRGNEAVIALPFGYIPEDGDEMSIWQTDYMRSAYATSRPLMNGSSGLMPPIFHTLGLIVDKFPDEESLKLLGQVADLRYVVYSSRYKKNFSATEFEQRLDKYQEQLTLLNKGDDGDYLFEIAPVLLVGTAKILVPPSKITHRVLKFEMQADSPQIEIEAKFGNTAAAKSAKIAVAFNKEDWTMVTLPIPATANAVSPLNVRIKPVARGGKLSHPESSC